jgi:alkylated DNA repair dioxygenase AlkB
MSKRYLQSTGQGDLFGLAPAMPEGFAYQDEVISADEEQVLLERLRTLPFKPYDFHGFLGHRHVISFGWHYDLSAATLRESEPIPDFLLAIREKAAAFASLEANRLQQVLINQYAPGAGIGWHRDRDMFRDVIAVSLGSTSTLRLRRKSGEMWDRAAQVVRPRSAYLLRGASRQAWQHSVPPVEDLRYSITFRNFVTAYGTHRRRDAERK